MKKMSPMAESVYTVAFMMAATAVCVGCVALAYQATKPTIERNEGIALKRAVLAAAAVEYDGAPEEIERRFAEMVEEVESKDGGGGLYRVKGGIEVFPVVGNGLWGKIHAVVGVDTAAGAFSGVYFTEDNETPGLGARINEPWFRKQFRGKRGPLGIAPEGTEAANDQFDAITGATITSQAVRSMLNQTLKEHGGARDTASSE